MGKMEKYKLIGHEHCSDHPEIENSILAGFLSQNDDKCQAFANTAKDCAIGRKVYFHNSELML
jgi:hypothetical protein